MKLLSLLLCLAMLLTGFAVAEEPAAESTVVTVGSAVLTIQDKEYPLNPSVVFGLAHDETSALIDFGVKLDDDVLFPVQAKIGADGAAVLLGDSQTAYTFTPAFFEGLLDGAEIPAELIEMLEAYVDLITATLSLDSSTANTGALADAELYELADVTEGEDAEFEIEGETLTGKQYAFEVSEEQMRQYMDEAFSTQLPAEFTDAYFRFLNATYALVGGPELNSFSELMDSVGMKISLAGNIIANDECGMGDMVMHFELDPSAMMSAVDETAVAEVTTEAVAEEIPATEAEEASIGIIGGADGPTSIMVTGVSTVDAEPMVLDIPMTITMISPEDVEVEVVTEIEGIQMNVFSAQYADGTAAASVTYGIPNEGTVSADVAQHPMDDGAVFTSVTMNADLGESWLSMLCEGTTLDGKGSTDVSITYADEAFSGGLSFTVDVTDEAIADRIAQAESKEINSIEEAEQSIGLMMAAMGLVGDAEPLLNDESVAALVEAGKELLGLNMMAAEPEYQSEVVLVDENDEYYYEDEYAADENASADAGDFIEPEFGYLPEGFMVAESTYDAEFSLYSATLLHETDEYYDNPVYINIYSYGDETLDLPVYYSINDGDVRSIDGTLVQLYRTEDVDFLMRNAYVSFGPYDVDIYAYGDSITDEDLIGILAGITFPEAAE